MKHWLVRLIIIGVIAILIELLLYWAFDQVLAYASNDSSYEFVISPTDEPERDLTPTPTITPTVAPSIDYDDLIDHIDDINDTIYDCSFKIMISVWSLAGLFLGYYLLKGTFK